MDKLLKGVGRAFRNLLRLRGLIFLAIILIPVIFGLFAVRQHQSAEPEVKDAPWLVQTYLYVKGIKTPSHTFYGQQYSTVNGVPTLLVYWEWNGRKYVKHEGTKSFPQSEWGAVDIVRRTQ
jgi:hypothetical protein